LGGSKEKSPDWNWRRGGGGVIRNLADNQTIINKKKKIRGKRRKFQSLGEAK